MPIYWQTTNVETPRHPSSSWANWKDGKFVARNRDEQREEEVKLPESFIIVAEWRSVRGYLEAKGWVYSNEIYSFKNDILTIRSNSWEILYEGLWNDIKDKVKAVGLKLTKNVHYVDPDDTEKLRTFCIKWAGLKAWLEVFTWENRFAAGNHLICFKEVKSGKTWAVKYTYPTFSICDPLTQAQKNIQQKWWVALVTYLDSVNVTADEINNEEEVTKFDNTETEVDNLPF